MIWRPKPGQHVRLCYAKKRRGAAPHHDRHGVVVVASNGRGPINALVELDGGELVVVPRGNLFAVVEAVMTESEHTDSSAPSASSPPRPLRTSDVSTR